MSKSRIKDRFRYIVGDQNLWLRRVNLHEGAFASPLTAVSSPFHIFGNDTHLFVYKRGRLVGCVELEPFMTEWGDYLRKKYPDLSPRTVRDHYRRWVPTWVWDLDSSCHSLECRKLNAALLKAALGLRKPSNT